MRDEKAGTTRPHASPKNVVCSQVVCAVLAALAGCATPDAPGMESDLFDDDLALAAPWGLPAVPELSVPSQAEQLERRLAALTANLERRRMPSGPAPQFDVASLRSSLTRIVRRLESRARVSVHVRDLRTGDVLFDYYGDTRLNPASNHKLLTAAAVLELLGPDYRFQTTVLRRDDTLYLVGTGDPTLMPETLAGMLDALESRTDLGGVARIVADDHVFSGRQLGPGYPTDGRGHGHEAPSGALSLQFNTVEVTVSPGPGRQPTVRVHPISTHVHVHNEARADGRRGEPTIESTSDGENRTLIRVSGRSGRARGPVTVRRRVADPGLFTAGAFAALLGRRLDAEPAPVERGEAPRDAEALWTHHSAPLAQIIRGGLAYSNNFIAEQLLRTLAWRMTGRPGDWEEGGEILARYWAALGHEAASVRGANASGLDTSARLSSVGLVDLIAVARRDDGGKATLVDVLPVAGEPGTLRARLRLSGKRVRAKTGTLRGVRALTGMVSAEDGTPQVAFSILLNAPEDSGRLRTGTAPLDALVVALLRHLDRHEAKRGMMRRFPSSRRVDIGLAE